MQKIWVIPDIHGYVNTLRALIEDKIRPEKSDIIYFLGDYIDRGPGVRHVIDLIRSLDKEGINVTALKGNHEDVLVQLYDYETGSKSPWLFNFTNRERRSWLAMGGNSTLQSFGVSSIKDIPAEYIDWMRNLQYYKVLDKYILVHAGLNCNIDDPFSDKKSMLWLRDYNIIPEKIGHRKIIHGHVPVNLPFIDLLIKNNSYNFIDLDNGPYLRGREGFGNLVALELGEMEMVIQDNLDD